MAILFFSMIQIKKIIIGIGIFIIMLAVAGLYRVFISDRIRGKLQAVKIGDVSFEVEIADNAITQAKGLSGREFLPKNKGMLFLFGGFGVRSFWMQGMEFPLDIIWISGDEIVGISENLPPAGFGELEVYKSPDSVDKVLEINAGLSEKFGFKIGDKIVLE